ncbi:MAG: hypothetical protein IT363_10535 [Methanoregulaceae archaeon]|nr:hypothetical protein [Methanoregulaceae archaeon]
MRRAIATIAALLGVVGAWAATVKVDGASVYVNDQLVVTLKSGRNEERAKTVGASFAKLPDDAPLKLRKAGTSYHVVHGSRIVITAAAKEAKSHGVTAKVLAQRWMASLQRAITLPPLQLPTDSLKVPIGRTQTLTLTGRHARRASVKTDNAAVVVGTRKDNVLTVQGRTAGDATLTLAYGEITKTLRVRVAPMAAQLPQAFQVVVTGNPASPEMVRGAIEGVLWTRFRSEPGTDSAFKLPDPGLMNSEAAKVLNIPVSVNGENAFPVDGNIQVTVRNEAIGFKNEVALWYCNHPENVARYQNLFAAKLEREQPVRLLYHHLNATPAGMYIEGQLVNESSQPARVVIMPGDSRPDRNPVLAGIVAGDQMLRNWVHSSGEVVTVPPRASISLAFRRLAPQDTMSGLCYLRLLPGGPSDLLFRMDSMPPYDGGPKTAAALTVPTPWRRQPPRSLDYEGSASLELSNHIYPSPFRNESVDYAVGGRHGFIRIGQRPIPRPDGKGLDGNFGVFYNIEARVENPQTDSADIEVVFEASAGYSGALFVLNGEVRRTPLLQPKEEAQIMRVRLQPGEKRHLTMMTVPLSGSSYPATIVVRPVGSGSNPIRKVY